MFYKFVLTDRGWVNTGIVRYGARPAEDRYTRWWRLHEAH